MSTCSHLAGVKQLIGGPVKLMKLYNKILMLTDKLPKDYAYRKCTEAIVCHRMNVLRQTSKIREIEQTICNGRIEMLYSQAEAEFELCQRMILWKSWEPLIQKPPPNQWKWPAVQM